ncbi:MAG: hypothetical protein ACKOU7_12025 [Ferruginibacter sp.]
MKNGQIRFEYFLNQFEELLVKSSKQKNPGLWLYQNNARTPLFMMEGLAKLYSGIHNKKKFEKLKTHFKLLEDTIGQIDYYDAFAKEFLANKKIPAVITNYLQAQSREKIQSLNEILAEKEWLGAGNARIKKIRKKLSKADWQDEKSDIDSIREFYFTSINKILEFINQRDFRFTNVENDVHEFRRMLRWLSIYPQALRGCTQLAKSKAAAPKFLSKYLTKAIITSPYNVMPDAADNKYFLLFDQKRFFALSWLIAELGNLKDNGLRVEVIKEAILQTTKTNEKEALAKAYQLAGPAQKTIPQILSAAGKLCNTFCKEKNLENLVTGIAAAKN